MKTVKISELLNRNPNYRCAGHYFGHPVYLHKNEYTINKEGVRSYVDWRFVETGKLIDEVDKTKLVCPGCNKLQTEKGHDPCIANLKGVKAACCGHGVEEPYVLLNNNTNLQGRDALDYFEEVRLNITVCIPSSSKACIKQEDGTEHCFTVKKYARLGEFLPMDKHILKMLVKRYDRMYIET